MSTGSRCGQLLRDVLSNEERFTEDPNNYNAEPLILLLRMLHHMPISWRKWILDVCRIQADPYRNRHLSPTKVDPPFCSITLGRSKLPKIVSPMEVADLLVNIIPSSLSLSFLSYFVRAESTAHESQFAAMIDQRLQAEIGQALRYDSTITQQRVNYDWMDIDAVRLSNPTHQMFIRGLKPNARCFTVLCHFGLKMQSYTFSKMSVSVILSKHCQM